MELIEGRNAKEERRFPKNVRQIGEPASDPRVLIEDYVYTFLRQMAESNQTCIKTAILLGEFGTSGIYIQGALDIDMGQEVSGWFSHEHWREIFREVQTWFEGLEVVGWFMANPGFPPELTEELRNLHLRNFSGEQYVFLQMDVIENEEIFYQYGKNGLAPLCGYYIYYEKNERMQAYMSQRRGGVGIEPEGILKDRAAARFRNVMQEKKEQNTQKKTMAFLYASCTFLVMVILVIGITMVNNYDRMTDMEQALHSISESLGESAAEETVSEDVEKEMPADIEQAVAEENQKAAEETAGDPEDTAAREEPQETVPEETVPEEQSEEVQEVMSQSVQEPERYEVQTGDTLLEICRTKYGTEDMLNEICELNELDDGDKIYVGQTLVLP